MVTAATTGQLWTDYFNRRDGQLREQLILQYAPLVKYVVGRLAIGLPSVLDFEDVLSYGTLGLIEAVERFDPSKGVKFETYAISRIRGSIIDALRALDRLPRSVRQKARTVDRATSELEVKFGRSPTDKEVADHLGITLDEHNEILANASWVTVSLDGLLEGNETGEGNPAVESPPPGHDEEISHGIERRELVETLAGEIDELPEREKLVIALYYQEELTMKEISKVLEISESRVCQLHAKALQRLRVGIRRAYQEAE
jgi:RNA polymerase sigma factor for flagellar operon FliA